MSRTILVTAPFSAPQLDELAAHGDVVYLPWIERGTPHTEEEMIALVREHDPVALIVEIDPVTAAVLDAGDLRVVGCCRAGLVNIDVDAARAAGIRVLKTPGRNAEAVAEYVIAVMIGALRNLFTATAWVQAGEWGRGERPYLKFRGSELGPKTVVLHGYGAVARRVAELLAPFGCRILAIDPYVDQAAAGDLVEMVDVETGYAAADILSIHLPVIEATRGAVDARLLGLLPDGALFINSARAAVVDYDALTAEVLAGRLTAVLDVYREEPLGEVDRALAEHPGVVALPHIAGATHDVVRHHSIAMAAAVAAVLDGREPQPRYVEH